MNTGNQKTVELILLYTMYRFTFAVSFANLIMFQFLAHAYFSN